MLLPIVTPETIPLDDPTVATAVLLLLHVPPVDALLNVAAKPTHIAEPPEIAAGNGITVTTLLTLHTEPK